MFKKIKLTKTEVVNIINSFINGTTGEYDWDDFISIPIEDPSLNEIRIYCANLRDVYPPTAGSYCNEEGINQLRKVVENLNNGVNSI